jgi:GT2 family glycosyltransferase
MKKIAILLAVFNRKEKTLECLAQLYKVKVANKNSFDVFLVDDGSTDGTTEAIQNEYPKVNIIQGNGFLFWNQGMRLAWNTAVKQNNYDFYIWLNDDSMLHENAIDQLLDCYDEIWSTKGVPALGTGACMESEENPVFSYGGRSEERNIIPNGSLQYCKYINGNIVLVSKSIFKELGVLSDDYSHGMGDYDYGLRAQQKGFLCATTKKYIAVCPTNKGVPVWCNPNKSFKKRLTAFYSPLGLNIKEYIVFRKKFWAVKWMLYAFKAYAKMLFPSLYIKITK